MTFILFHAAQQGLYTPEWVFTHLVTYRQVQTCDGQDQITHKTASLLSLHLLLAFKCSNGTFLSIASLMTSNVDPLRGRDGL